MNEDDIEQWPSRVVDIAMRMADMLAALPAAERQMALRMFNEFARLDNQARGSEEEEEYEREPMPQMPMENPEN